ncbi:hypothetical protein RRG08_031585 [Elysia crispata]|uniref:Uncharacterized protein n=1 Tax=Elysia crispata TaxID=231223 RepID=A0AAE1B3A2_9GAST|nr:hypothetical protein RRG08_031585 [Elysia crispata]
MKSNNGGDLGLSEDLTDLNQDNTFTPATARASVAKVDQRDINGLRRNVFESYAIMLGRRRETGPELSPSRRVEVISRETRQ